MKEVLHDELRGDEILIETAPYIHVRETTRSIRAGERLHGTGPIMRACSGTWTHGVADREIVDKNDHASARESIL